MNDVLDTFIDGLTYQRQYFHIVLNYTLIVLTVIPFTRDRDRERQGWKLCFAIITFLQVLIWFLVDSVGVSLIWCAMAGFLALDIWQGREEPARDKKRLAQVALIAALAAIVYYAAGFPIITTIAHGVAVLVGMGIFSILQRGVAG